MKDDIKNKLSDDGTEKLQYKQIVLIVLLTVIMILSSLTLSFSAVKMISASKNLNYNSIIAEIPKSTGGDPVDPGNNDMVFSYEEGDLVGNGIYINNMAPTLDKVGASFIGPNYTFEFKLYFGDKTSDYYYEITAEKMLVSNLDSKNVKIYLETENVAVPSVYRDNGKIKTFDEYSNATIDINNDAEKIIYSANVTNEDVARGYKSFVLKMWLSEDAILNEKIMNKTFATRINVYAK